MSQDSPKLSLSLRALSLLAVTTGSLDMIIGPKVLANTSELVTLPPTTLSLIDNQMRFFGAIWAGYGVMLWWVTNDMRARSAPLKILMAVMVAAGVGRTFSGIKYGFAASWLKAATLIELVVPAVVYLGASFP